MNIKNLDKKIDGKEKVNNDEFRFLCKNHKDYNLTKLDTSYMTDMSFMFYRAEKFNQDIGKWNVGKVETMDMMFADAQSFNQDLSGWDVGNVKNMCSMFKNAYSFNKDFMRKNSSCCKFLKERALGNGYEVY